MSEPTILEIIYNTVQRMEAEQIKQGKDIERLKAKAGMIGGLAGVIGSLAVGIILMAIKSWV